MKLLKYLSFSAVIPVLFAGLIIFQSCSSFNYKTYIEQKDVDDPEPNYNLTLNPEFQEYTSYMFIGNRIENFGTYFNTFFNAKENYEVAYEDYVTRVLANYSERLDSIYSAPVLTQEAKDKFNKAIEKASKVIQYHKSSAFMDQAVLLIGESYYYLGDYLKAERKFSEFISKLTRSPLLDEALLFLARTQLRLGNYEPALARLNNLIQNSKDKAVVAGAYQSLAEYYIYIKDYESSLKNYNKSIEFSNDNEFKAQMQFLVASVTARQDPAKGAGEFLKVLNYSTTFELEYLARFNHVKNLILSNNFKIVPRMLDQLNVSYKDNPEYLPDISYLRAMYYDQKKNYKQAEKYYKQVIISYPKSIASSDACFALGDYYENKNGDYLKALWYYRIAGEENANGHHKEAVAQKLRVYTKYFELRSVIAGTVIKTDYDTAFLKQLRPELKQEGIENIENQNKGKGDQGPGGKPGGIKYEPVSDSSNKTSSDSLKKMSSDSLKKMSSDSLKKMSSDSLKKMSSDSLNKTTSIDSTGIKTEKIAKAKFELAELFVFDINKPDSAEKYLKQSYDESQERDFKGKVLYALADLYRNTNRSDKYESALKDIINEFPTSHVANECRKLLNLPAVDEVLQSTDDSIYIYAENRFAESRYNEALTAFKEISENHSASPHCGKANYAIGWIYENIFSKPDSAFYYYSKLSENTSASELLGKVIDKITEYRKQVSGSKDSLDFTDTSKTLTDTSKIKIEEKKEPPTIDETGETVLPEKKKEDLPNKNLEQLQGEEKKNPNDPIKDK